MARLKRAAAIHDISGVGKCSLTVALPILSAAGVECSVIPTAVLSTHTGGFNDFTYRDLTDDILPIAKHWASLNLQFDSIYTGYLGSQEQIEIVLKTIDLLRCEDTLILIDPVMADAGELYKTFDNSFPKKMLSLCKKADILIPNITEACLLTETPYESGPYSKDYIETLIDKLKKVTDKKIVLTGVYFDEDMLGCACFDNETGGIDYCFSENIKGFYHGTGDVFGSVLLSAIMNDKTLKESAQIAVDITTGAIRRTKEDNTDVRFGVRFEDELPNLIKSLGK
ncbi:MAG: pyridoxamine kinase [Acutalibacteraceae bacterium]|nr:pyridoxamine kinase [Acutalibacteraceae bacterium]